MKCDVCNGVVGKDRKYGRCKKCSIKYFDEFTPAELRARESKLTTLKKGQYETDNAVRKQSFS